MSSKASASLLSPRSVALIGASSNARKLTARPLTFLARHGFEGAIYPINPGTSEIAGHQAYATIHETPETPDHAYIMLDTDPALDALEECGKAGISTVTILADGFGEAGEAGQARQARLIEIAEQYDISVIGPNSTGVVNTSIGFTCTTNAAFAAEQLIKGRFAVLSQSGSVIGTMLSRAAAVGLGFHAYVSLGNEACLGLGEVGHLLVDDPNIDGFVFFMESLRRTDVFAEFAARARSKGKPILAYVVGRSEAGQHLAASHTGAMTGGARALEAFLDAHGVVRVNTLEVLAELANAIAIKPQLKHRPKTATVVTTTGGGGGMVYDQIGLHGVSLSPMPETLRQSLGEKGVEIKPGALVDVTLAGTNYDTMKAVMAGLIEDAETGLVVAAIGSSAQFNPELAVKPIVDAVSEAGPDAAPVVAIPIPHAPDSLRLFNSAGVPAFRTPENAAEAVAALLAEDNAHHLVAAELPEDASALLDTMSGGTQNEAQSAQLFHALGLNSAPSVVVSSADILPKQIPFDGPYVLKILSADIAHKSDSGGVRLGLASREDVANAITDMHAAIAKTCPEARIDGYLVQKLVKGIQEAIIGFTRDPVVGPLVSVGVGGVMTEIYQDIAIRPAPVSPEIALEMLLEVRGLALSRGYRNGPKGDLNALAIAVAQISHLAASPDVEEAEANPTAILHEGDGVVFLDALVRMRG